MKKVILCLVMLMLLMNFTSAFLNVKGDLIIDETTSKYGKIEIKDWWGISKLAELELKKNTDYCGTKCYAEKEITLHQKAILIEDVKFTVPIKSYSFYIQEGTINVVVDDYSKICNVVSNKTGSYNICNRQKTGSHIETRPKWVPYILGTEKPAGTYKIKLLGNKGEHVTTDWIIKSQGQWIDEWAVWSSSLDTNLISYYQLDEGSGSVLDSLALNNLTNQGATPGVTGKIKTAYDFENSSTEYINGTFSTISNDSFSISAWAQIESSSGANFVTDLSKNGDLDTIGYVFTETNLFRFRMRDDVGAGITTVSGGATDTGVFYHIVATYNQTDQNMTLYINGTQTDSDTFAGSTFTLNHLTIGAAFDGVSVYTAGWDGVIDEVGIWNRTLSPSEVIDLYNNDSALPFFRVNIIGPDNASTFFRNETINFSANFSSIGGLKNSTLFVDGVSTNTTNITGSTNVSSFLTSFTTVGIRTWSIQACDVNDTCFSSDNRTVSIALIKEIGSTFNATSFETALQVITTNITTNGSTPSAGELIYAGVSRSATITNIAGDNYSISTTFDTPVNVVNNSFFFNFTVESTEVSTISNNQSVSETRFTLCNATFSTEFLNISFKDEEDSSALNASVPASTFIFYLGSGTVTKSFSLVNNSNNFNYSFCASPTNQTINVDPVLQYRQGTAYPQRVWDPIVTSYTNTTTQQTLFLLAAGDGLFVTLQVLNTAFQTLSGVDVTVTRILDSVDTTVAQGTTGDSGALTFFLNPNFDHTFTFEKTGFTTLVTTFKPDQAGFTITLSGTSTIANSTIQGIDYSIIPLNNSLVNDTVYTFGFNLTSSFWDIEEYGFNLRLKNGTIITGSTSTIAGTPLTLNYNTTNQTIIYIDAFWNIGGVYTNVTRFWYVQKSGNTGFSIAFFFTDLALYLDSGIFGLDTFGLNLLIFLVIFIGSGILGFKYGLNNPLITTTMIFSVVFFFDVVVDLIPTIRGIDNLLTYIVALLIVIELLLEVRR